MPVFAHVPAHTNKRPTSWKLFCFVCLPKLKLFSIWQPVAQSGWKHLLDSSVHCGLLEANGKVTGKLGAGTRCTATLGRISGDSRVCRLLPVAVWSIFMEGANWGSPWEYSGRPAWLAWIRALSAISMLGLLLYTLLCSWQRNWHPHFIEKIKAAWLPWWCNQVYLLSSDINAGLLVIMLCLSSLHSYHPWRSYTRSIILLVIPQCSDSLWFLQATSFAWPVLFPKFYISPPFLASWSCMISLSHWGPPQKPPTSTMPLPSLFLFFSPSNMLLSNPHIGLYWILRAI